ncbi:DUF5305 domain-containing protein [Natronoarchaeum rubrum]|uniref:DUF5305 domain-containing protein n=1 Tax=Natronoarchaeum rubrum TaxID=755311 RepID=UPI0021110BA2|nr:DUF5305 domain-containing protein [Natronoarchaeum rubrum]
MTGTTDTPEQPSKTVDDTPGGITHRAREFAATQLPLVVAGLLLLAALGAGVTYAPHVSPGEQTESEVVGTWSDAGRFDHAATVQRDTEVFANGTELDDRSTYFTRASPELNVEYAYRHRATKPAAVRTNLSLVVRSTDGDDVLWETTERLDRTSSGALAPGERQNVTATVNVSRVRDRIRRIETDLGAAAGEPSIRVVAVTDATVTVADETVDRNREDVLTITTDGGTYDVTSEGGSWSDDVTHQRTVPAEYGPLRSLGGPALALGAIAGLVGLGWAHHTGRLGIDPQRRRRRAVRREREEFDDWITVGRLPDDLGGRTTVETESLEGLVDVAIDSDRRVVEDPSTGLFAVLDGDVAYTFDPPGTDLVPVEDSEHVSESDAFDETEPADDGAEPSDPEVTDINDLLGDDFDVEPPPSADE